MKLALARVLVVLAGSLVGFALGMAVGADSGKPHQRDHRPPTCRSARAHPTARG